MAATKKAASHTFCKSRYLQYPGALAPGRLWWHVENQRRYSHPFSSNGNLRSHSNANTYSRHDGDLNAFSWDNGDSYPVANTRDNAGAPTNTQTNTVALRYAPKCAACISDRNCYRQYQ